MQVLNDDSHKILGITQMISKNHEQVNMTRFRRFPLKTPSTPLVDSSDKTDSSSHGLTSQATMCHSTGFGVQLQEGRVAYP